jgi:hypothetical protein
LNQKNKNKFSRKGAKLAKKGLKRTLGINLCALCERRFWFRYYFYGLRHCLANTYLEPINHESTESSWIMTPHSEIRNSSLVLPYLRVADLASEIRRDAHDRGGSQGQEKDDDHDPSRDSAGYAKKKQPRKSRETQGFDE